MIYFDYAASTPICEIAKNKMLEVIESDHLFTNPSVTTYDFAKPARALVEQARGDILSALNLEKSHYLIFTSGATESINLVNQGVCKAYATSLKQIVCTHTDHKATLVCLESLAHNGSTISMLNVDKVGAVDLNQLEQLLKKGPALVNLCWVNNETGVIAPVVEVAKLCQKYGALLHLDAAQAIGKTDLSDIKYADFISLSAHKFYGPKGSGALIIRNNRRITPLFYGGGQEFTLRPGTVATHQIVGLHYALLDTCSRYGTELNTISALSEKMVNCLTEMGCVINGANRTPFIVNAQFPDIDQFAQLKNRVTSEFACAAGSACQSSNQAPSHVLTAMGLTSEAVSRSLRFSLGYASQAEELVSFSDLLSQWL